MTNCPPIGPPIVDSSLQSTAKKIPVMVDLFADLNIARAEHFVLGGVWDHQEVYFEVIEKGQPHPERGEHRRLEPSEKFRLLRSKTTVWWQKLQSDGRLHHDRPWRFETGRQQGPAELRKPQPGQKKTNLTESAERYWTASKTPNKRSLDCRTYSVQLRGEEEPDYSAIRETGRASLRTIRESR